jgi:hypothetical protein
VFSREYLTRELELVRDAGLKRTLLVDAALNLNPRAFRNLVAAERDVRVLRDTAFTCEVYPSHLSDEHLSFLEELGGRADLGIGLQSYDKEVLRRLNRPFDEARFERVVRTLSSLGCTVTVEIIAGLPGDTPASFLRTLERARELPCRVRVFHCLVLPDALLDRAPPWADMVFDPVTLQMQSCAGWSERELAETVEKLSLMQEEVGGRGSITWFWLFPNQQGEPAPAATPRQPRERPRGADVQVLGEQAVQQISTHVATVTEGRWSVRAVERSGGVVVLKVEDGGEPIEIEVKPAHLAERAFQVVGDVAVSYRLAGNAPRDTAAVLGQLILRSPSLLHRLAFGDAAPPRPRPLPVVR